MEKLQTVTVSLDLYDKSVKHLKDCFFHHFCHRICFWFFLSLIKKVIAFSKFLE